MDGTAEVQHRQVSPGILYCILNESQAVDAHGAGLFKFAPAPAGKLRGVEDICRGEFLHHGNVRVIGVGFLARQETGIQGLMHAL